MSVEAGLIDANILIYAMDSRAPKHIQRRVLLEADHEAGTTLYVPSQILREFYSVVTNPRRVALPRSAAEGDQRSGRRRCARQPTVRRRRG